MGLGEELQWKALEMLVQKPFVPLGGSISLPLIKMDGSDTKPEINEMLDHIPDVESKRALASRNLCNEVIQMLKDDSRRIHDRVGEIADAVKELSTPLDFSACEVAGVVSSVFHSLGILAQERQVLLRTENLELLPLIVADQRRLYSAFYNLINNAIPEVSAGGSVTVCGQLPTSEGTIVVSVIDTGGGMPPDVRDRLFTKRAISTKPGGTGLGMKIVKHHAGIHRYRYASQCQ